MHNYANVWTINQSKSLPGFQVVMTSLDGINGRSIQTLLRGENDSKHLDEIRATDKAPRSSSKLTPLSVVFSTLFSVFYLVMKHCLSCLIYLRKAFIICPTLERLSQAPPPQFTVNGSQRRTHQRLKKIRYK